VTHAPSLNRLFSGGALSRDPAAIPDLRAQRSIRLDGPIDHDELRGKLQRGQRGGEAPVRVSQGLDARLGPARRFGFRRDAPRRQGPFDSRQRAIVKIHFFGHSGGGGAALLAHGRYVAREAARSHLEQAPETERDPHIDRGEEERAHAAYLARNERAVFYDALTDEVDGRARMNVWAEEDRRHFRIILSPENGPHLGDLKSYTRAVMERAESVLGGRLEWVAIDHHDTDNPHTHIVLRGRRANGRPLILPRDFVKAGLREIARDEATSRVGPRTRADENAALLREARAHRPTRLDALIARQIERDRLRIARLEAPTGDPALTKALKVRARELKRLGLASAPRRNVLVFTSDWRERLRAMELHLDIRKRLVLERSQQRDIARSMPGLGPQRGPDR
jgi:type IV secretory pathway VirD2 relaxase